MFIIITWISYQNINLSLILGSNYPRAEMRKPGRWLPGLNVSNIEQLGCTLFLHPPQPSIVMLFI